jgi:hypothetical protein
MSVPALMRPTAFSHSPGRIFSPGGEATSRSALLRPSRPAEPFFSMARARRKAAS